MKRLFSSKIFLCVASFCVGIIVAVVITTNRELFSNYQRELPGDQNEFFSNFNNKFNSWFDTRFGGGKASDIQIREDKNHLYYEIKVDHLADQNVKIDIQDNSVIISGRIDQEKQKEGQGIKQQHKYSARFFRSFPAPHNIDPDKTDVTVKGEQISIRFEKKG